MYAGAVRRIAIIGPGGTGKSTLARELGGLLGIAPVHLDALYWRPGWVEPPRDEWRALVQELTRGERWILDGNYSGTLDLRLAAADTVIFLDLPRVRCLWRVLSRWLRFRGRPRPDMAPGCAERLTWDFVTWIWTFPSRRRPEILRQLDACRDSTRIVHLRHPTDVRRFLDTVTAKSARSRIVS